MAASLLVNLLGPPRIALAEVPVTCASRKALALFVYVLLSGRMHARRELAAMLWGRRDDEGARASLRVALHRLPPSMAICLRVDRDTVVHDAARPLLVDVTRFESLARADDLASLEEAASLYQGELLQDFDADATPEFDDWLHAQRTRLAQLAQQVFDGVIARRAERARQDGGRATRERESALATGLRWVALMPGAEAAHRWLMRIYLDMGRRDAALVQFDLCQRSLAVTCGRPPSPESRALYETALAGEPRRAAGDTAQGPAAASEPVAHALVPATSFVGRVEELAELDRLLADPACRLVTLHGLGGAGKTRLAHALASQIGARFAQGVCWVALETAAGPEALPVAIATALGRELPPHGDRGAAVADMLAGQQRLVVLDNVESLLADGGSAPDADPVAVVTRILATAHHVRILATSREVLGLQEEWVYDVRGLPYASESAAAPAAPAVELFAQRARQAYLGFSLPAEMPHVLRICGLVEGLPLGIELAAAWVRTIPCGEIAAAIEREAATLASPHRNRVARQQTLEAVVAYSWNLLSNEQQYALAGLGAFAGGFTREAAERIAEAPLRMVSVLVDKALVRRRVAEDRYDMHELVRQFAWTRLQKMRTRRTAVGKRHAEWFAALLLQASADSGGPAEVAASALLHTELPNIMTAWDRSVAGGARDVIERMAAPWVSALIKVARIPAALAAAERAIAVLGRNGRDEVVGAIRLHWGRAAILGGDPEAAQRELDAALALAHHGGKPAAIARALYYLGSAAYQKGEIEAAEALAAEALPLAVRSGEPDVIALTHNMIGSFASVRSRFGVAEEHLRLGLAAARDYGAPSLIAGLLVSLAVPFYYRGEFAEAAKLTEEAAGIYEALGRNSTTNLLRGNLAAMLLAHGDLAGALGHAQTAVRMARDSGDQVSLGGALATLADILLQQDRLPDARVAAQECLDLWAAPARPLITTEAHFLLASIALRDGRHGEGMAHILRLRDMLAENRIEVRVPMLILAAADWIATAGDDAAWSRARRWVTAVARLEDVDATLRDKGRHLLAREAAARGEPPDSNATDAPLADVEAEVCAFLADLPGNA